MNDGIRAKKETAGMATNNDPRTAAAASLRAFLRRTFSKLANDAQADSLAYRKALEALK